MMVTKIIILSKLSQSNRKSNTHLLLQMQGLSGMFINLRKIKESLKMITETDACILFIEIQVVDGHLNFFFLV